MLGRVNPDSVDFELFYSKDEGFASWHFKVLQYIGEHYRSNFPPIEANKDNGKLVLKHPEVIGYISDKTSLSSTIVGEMINVDIEALNGLSTFFFADEFISRTTIELPKLPKKYCLSCLINSIERRELPIFKANWLSPFTAFCEIHSHSLSNIDNLTREPSHGDYVFQIGSQYEYWKDRLTAVLDSHRSFLRGSEGVFLKPASTIALQITKLFSEVAGSKEAAQFLSSSEDVEAVRERVFGVTYLLCQQRDAHSIGYQLTRGDGRGGCFPTTNCFNHRTLDVIKLHDLQKCIDIVGQIICENSKYHPFLFHDHMKEAHRSRISRTGETMEILIKKPMHALAWLIYNHFGKSFVDPLAKMFPLFADEWAKVYDEVIP